jgi:uncharacterized repeat protein (TIGR03803 family)
MQFRCLQYSIARCCTKNAACFVFLLLLVAIGTTGAFAQNFNVIHYFTGSEGWTPNGTLLLDQGGNLWGEARFGGAHNVGTVYKMTRHGTNWTLQPLYSFLGTYDHGNCSMGGCPQGGLVRDAGGVVYGVTNNGGMSAGGTVFRLRPSTQPTASLLTQWLETMLYGFDPNRGGGGVRPSNDSLAIDAQGNLYGTTEEGGISDCFPLGCGTVYKLQKMVGGYSYFTLYKFNAPQTHDGSVPWAGVTFDNAGNLYGTTVQGGTSGQGTVFQLTHNDSGWTETVIYNFRDQEDGRDPTQGISVGPNGELYGSTSMGGSGGGGVVFQLTPSTGGWTYTPLSALSGNYGPLGGRLTVGNDGSLYGATYQDGASQQGNVFKLQHSGSGWTYTSLHDFTCGLDGCFALGGVTIDPSGTLYGTAAYGGMAGNCNSDNHTCGVVWEIAP